jgi:hypothetical protein
VWDTTQSAYRFLTPWTLQRPYQVGHGLEFDTASHAARGAGFLDARFVGFRKDPDGVVRVAEDPEIVATDVGQLLQVSLVDTWAMQGVDKLVRRKGDLWRFGSSWCTSE